MKWRIVSVTCSLLSKPCLVICWRSTLLSLHYLVPGCTALHSLNHSAQSCCLQHTLQIFCPSPRCSPVIQFFSLWGFIAVQDTVGMSKIHLLNYSILRSTKIPLLENSI